jgi:hypothetical protein
LANYLCIVRSGSECAGVLYCFTTEYLRTGASTGVGSTWWIDISGGGSSCIRCLACELFDLNMLRRLGRFSFPSSPDSPCPSPLNRLYRDFLGRSDDLDLSRVESSGTTVFNTFPKEFVLGFDNLFWPRRELGADCSCPIVVCG